MISSEQPISVNILPATRLANVSPDMVNTGHSDHIASLVDVWPLYGYVSRNKSII